jgi:hypothetical protein
MTSLRKVLGGRFVLGVVFWACACEHDSVATFDDSRPSGSSNGGTSGAVGGSLATAGDAAVGGEDASAAGASAEAGSTAVAGKGGAPSGGHGGGSAAGASSSAGKPSAAGGGGKAGSAGGGAGGSGGTNEPEPVTVTTSDFADTYVASCISSNFGEEQTLRVDYAYSCVYQTLMNPSLADVPDGALVSAATLTLHCINAGDVVTMSHVAGAWKEDTVRWSTRPESGSALAELTCSEMGDVSVDLTAVVKAWVSGERAANGLYFHSEGSNGTDFTSSEYEDVGERPSLSVTYTLPAK